MERPQKIRFIQRVKTERGVRLYFRKGDMRRALVSPDGSEALRLEVEAILAELNGIARAATPTPGTIAGAIRTYNRSAEFLSLARSTQKSYQTLLDEIAEDAGDVMLMDVTAALVVELKNLWAQRGHRAANLRLQILKNALEPAVIDGRVPSDPFARLKKVRRPHSAGEAHPVWEDAEVEAIIGLAIARKMPGLARAIALGRWAGFRRGTICAVPLNARTVGYDASGHAHRRLHWVTEKTRVVCDKPEDARLTALLETTPNRALTIAYNSVDKPWKERQLNQAVDRLIDRLTADGKARPNLTLHGLRHTRGVELALAGASDSEIMSQLEHNTSRAAQIYRRQAQRRRLADGAQAKIDQALVLIQSKKGATQNG